MAEVKVKVDSGVVNTRKSKEYAQKSEAWAVGKVDGVDVPNTADQYHNNSKYYKEIAMSAAATATNMEYNAEQDALNSEAYAVGKRNGSDVTSGDPAYHNNSKYFAIEAYNHSADADNAKIDAVNAKNAAASSKLDSEAYAVGTRNGTAVTSGDPAYHNNAKYYKDQSASYASDAHSDANYASGYASQASASATTASGHANAAAGSAGTAAAAATAASNSATAAAASASAIAATYDSTKTYAVGEYCLYNGGMYVCTTAITTAEAWTAGHWLAVKVGTELTALKEDLDYMSNRLYKSVSTYSTKYDSSGTIAVNGNIKSILLPLKDGYHYHFEASGAFNRWNISGANSLETGSSCTRLETSSTEDKTHETYEFTNTNNYKYAIILVGYYTSEEVSAFNCNFTYQEIRGSLTDGLIINGYRVIMDEEKNALLKTVTDGDYIQPATYVDTNYCINNSTIVASPAGKTLMVPIKNNKGYEIEISGVFNRFSITGADSVELGTGVTVIKNYGSLEHKQQTMRYTYESDGTYDYLAILYNYNGEGAASNISIKCNEFVLDDDFTVNGVPVYTEHEVDELLSNVQALNYENYISSAEVEVAVGSSALYALYDALVSQYPSYASKSVLGQDASGNDLVEYVFTSGNYNSYTTYQRNQDAPIPKPVVLILTGCHGYEKTSVMSVYQFIKDLCDGHEKLLNIRGNYTIKVMPLGCPYSFNNNTRVNVNGVNIVRNFDANWTYSGYGTEDYSGASAADQLETQAIQTWLDDNTSAELFIDFHNSGYANEVSFFGGNDSINGMASFKRTYLESIYRIAPYWQIARGFSTSLLYAYTGNFDYITGSSYGYGVKEGIFSGCLECSWNQNNSGQHSSLSIKTGAESLGNILRRYTDK